MELFGEIIKMIEGFNLFCEWESDRGTSVSDLMGSYDNEDDYFRVGGIYYSIECTDTHIDCSVTEIWDGSVWFIDEDEL
jgi:NAD-specific glutamate dehydrogenase